MNQVINVRLRVMLNKKIIVIIKGDLFVRNIYEDLLQLQIQFSLCKFEVRDNYVRDQ